VLNRIESLEKELKLTQEIGVGIDRLSKDLAAETERANSALETARQAITNAEKCMKLAEEIKAVADKATAKLALSMTVITGLRNAAANQGDLLLAQTLNYFLEEIDKI
jgi:hypothetical protein